MEKHRSNCLFSYALEVWGDKWSLLIIRDMIFTGKTTFGEFLKSPECIATNILTNRLQRLEQEGIIEKREHPDSKAKNLYTLTQKGLDILPVLVEVYLWADKYQDLPESMQVYLEIFKGENKGKATKAKIEEIKKKYKESLMK